MFENFLQQEIEENVIGIRFELIIQRNQNSYKNVVIKILKRSENWPELKYSTNGIHYVYSAYILYVEIDFKIVILKKNIFISEVHLLSYSFSSSLNYILLVYIYFKSSFEIWVIAYQAS